MVTRRGRELIQRAVAELEARGADVIEVDTDGIYFVAPFALDDEAAAQALLDEIGAAMPAGIRLEIDGRYPAMFSYKMKNYVLLDETRRDDDSRVGTEVARPGALSAPIHGGAVSACCWRIGASEIPAALCGLARAYRAARNRHRATDEDRDAAGLARNLPRENRRQTAQRRGGL